MHIITYFVLKVCHSPDSLAKVLRSSGLLKFLLALIKVASNQR